MQKTADNEHYIPIMDCRCGAKNIPLSASPVYAHPEHPEYGKIQFFYCPKCERAPYGESKVKGFINVEELKAMGYQEQESEG